MPERGSPNECRGVPPDGRAPGGDPEDGIPEPSSHAPALYLPRLWFLPTAEDLNRSVVQFERKAPRPASPSPCKFRQGRHARADRKFSQEMLAEMIGTTRSRVSFFMNKFRKLGFIEYMENSKSINPC